MSKLTIYQNRIKDCDNSFWYNGIVAMTNKGIMTAVGDIRIHDKDDQLVHDGWKERNNGLSFELKDDNDLAKIGNEIKEYHWENNNWFEVFERNNTQSEAFIGYSYNEALKVLKSIK